MKNCVKKMVVACLALVMAFAAMAPGKVQAATKSMTLYKGEEAYVSNYYAVKSVSSSKKAVASVAKDKSNNTHANITAKKAGKTTITVKTKNGTMKYNVTVKNLDITGTLKDMGNGQLLVTIKNNTAQTFDYVTMSYTLKDETGDVKDQDTMTVSDVVAGKTVYKSIYYSQSVFTPDLSQSSVKVTGDSRVLSAKYTDASKKVTTDVTLEEEDTSTMKFYIKTTNKLKKQNLSGYVYIRVYDETGSLVDLLAYPFALQGSAVDTGTRSSYFKSDTDISNYTYKVTTVAYYYKIS